MKTSRKSLIAVLTIGAAAVAASGAMAGGFSFGGGGNKGGFKVNFSGQNNHNKHNNHNNHSHNHHKHGHHHHAHHNHHHHVRYYTPPVRIVYSQCYHPQYRLCYVYPGDTWYSISKRVYGVEFLCKHIASYNGLSMYSQLVPGQMLRLPVVNANGSLGVSNAPVPAPFAPQETPFSAAVTQPVPQGSTLAPQGPSMSPSTASVSPSGPAALPANVAAAAAEPAVAIRTVKEEPTLPRVATGSTLMLDGKSLGEEKGVVRLQLGALTLPVEVIEWTTSTVKIELPKLELSRPMKASLEVLRADGSLASKSEIEVTPAAARLALSN